MTQPIERVAVIGLGAMGLPMASRLAKRFTVSGFDPFEERRDAAAAAGVTTGVTPADAADGVDLVLVSVRDAAQADAALFGVGGATETLAPGGIVMLTSTIGPDAARELETRLVAAGFRVVDAPVSGGPVRAGNGDLLVVVGADPETLADAREVLDALASTLTVVGDKVGDGQMLKVINQLLAGVHIAAAAEAIALARGVGLDPDVVINALKEGAAGSFMFADRGPRMIETYTGTPQVKSRVDIFVKDMGIVTDIAGKAQVPTPLASAARELYLEAERAGLGAADDSSIVTILSPKD